MKYATIKAGILVACMLSAQCPAYAENPLFMPRDEAPPPVLSATEAAGMKKEAETLKRKAELLKGSARKKYAAAEDLRKKAGGYRSESSQKGEALRSKAEQDAAVSGFIGDMFGMISSMGGGQLSSNAAFASAITGKMVQGQQSMDAQAVMDAQGRSGQLNAEAEKKAGPLEMRADEFENEGNRLMEAHNRIISIANAKYLLVAADELLLKIDGDGRRLERIKEDTREFISSLPSR
jgi:hypothetical protein